MANYLLTYYGGGMPETQEEQAQVMQAWTAWFGQLGDGTTTMRPTPVDVTGLSSNVAAVDAGTDHTCALTTTGGVKCWGYNSYGQLGDGTTTNRPTSVPVIGRPSCSQICRVTSSLSPVTTLTATPDCASLANAS